MIFVIISLYVRNNLIGEYHNYIFWSWILI